MSELGISNKDGEEEMSELGISNKDGKPVTWKIIAFRMPVELAKVMQKACIDLEISQAKFLTEAVKSQLNVIENTKK